MLYKCEPKIREILSREPRGFFNDEVKELQLFSSQCTGIVMSFDDATFILKNFNRNEEGITPRRRRKDHPHG